MPSSSPLPSLTKIADRIAIAPRMISSSPSITMAAGYPPAACAEEQVQQRDRAGLVEGVVLVAALGRLDARRAPALALAAGDRLAGGGQPLVRRRGSPARRSRRHRGARRGRRRSAARCRRAGRSRPHRCPTGRTWRTAAAGRSSSARPRAPRPAGRRRPAPTRRARRSGTVHHTAVVRSERSGRSSGSSPITSPPGWRRLRNDTTWWDTSTSPSESRQAPQSRCSRSASDRDVGDLAGRRRVVGLGAVHDRHVLVEVERLDQPGLAAVHVDRAGVGGAVGARPVHRADDPAGGRPR